MVLPWPEDGQSYINIHWSAIGQNGRKFWAGRACSTVDEFIRTLDWALKGDPKDIYVCMSAQARCEEKTSQKGHKYKSALRSSNDVVAIRSLFLDIDVKEGAYEDTTQALHALKAFVTSVGIPLPSAVVASGSGGFHAHWALDKVMTRDEWQVLANALARAAQDHGLHFDSQCTVDSARILRVPDTLNWKTDPPRPVKLLSCGSLVSHDDMVASLGKYIEVLPPRQVVKIAANDELGAGVTTQAQEIEIAEVAKHCGFVARSLGTGGAENSNPLWFMTASIATFVVEGRDALHLMSNQHKDYVPVKTDELYDRVTMHQKQRDLGWPKCEKIAAYGCKECQSCPLLLQKKSPLNFVLKAANDTPDLTLPERYVRNTDGIIMLRTVDENGTPITFPICAYPMNNGWLSNNPWTLHFTTKLDNGRRQLIEIPCEVITAKDSLAKYLGGKGFFCTDKDYKILKEFLVAWLRKLQNSKDSVISASPFGWSVVDGKIEGFAYGGRVWMKDTDRPAANPDPVLSYQYSPRGNREPWDKLVKVICDQRRPALNAILASGFAGPLVRFTGHPGLLLNAYSSESGIGKTTAMKCAQSIWGDPIRAMQGLNDTSNSVLNKMGHIKALPMFWDEIKSEAQVKRFCQVVFDLTGGREKTRLSADSTLKMSGTWQTIMTSASNDSLIDPMAREVGSTTAGLYRMFEYVVPIPTSQSNETGAVQRLIGQLDDNFGHPGLAYSQFLGAHHERVAQEVAKVQDELSRDHAGKQDERFWFGTMAVLIKGAEYGNELGLTAIDVPGLKDFLLEVLSDMRKQVAATPSDVTTDMNASAILAEFLNVHRSRNTIVTNRIHVSKGKPPVGSIKVLNDISKISELRVQVGKDDKLIRISSTYFTGWIGKSGHSRVSWTKKMESE
ncbi:MAG: DUF927 domain-containing protein, partial [Candidatus Nanopelagicales bacterium]